MNIISKIINEGATFGEFVRVIRSGLVDSNGNLTFWAVLLIIVLAIIAVAIIHAIVTKDKKKKRKNKD